jgi:hypothetical protein
MSRSALVLLTALTFLPASRAADPPPAGLAEKLQSSLGNLPELRGIRITSAVHRPDGTVELDGTLPNGKLREVVQKKALEALRNYVAVGLLPGPFNAVDASRLIDQSLPRDEQVLFVLQKKLMAREDLRDNAIDSVQLRPEGTVVLEGFVYKDDLRRVLEQEGRRLLEAEVRRQHLQGPLGAVDASTMKRFPNRVFGELERSLRNLPELRRMVLVYAERADDGTVWVVGLVPTEPLRSVVEQQGLRALQNAVEARRLPGPVTRLDTTRLLVGTSHEDLLQAVETLCPSEPPLRVVRVQRFSLETGVLAVGGVAGGAADRARLIRTLEKLPVVKRVEDRDLLVAASFPSDDSASVFYNRAVAALGRQSGREMVEASSQVVRQGHSKRAIVIRAWYLRAAGHLLQGQAEQAVGDLRVADALEQRWGQADFYLALERFQGPSRDTLGRLIDAGPRGALTTPDRPVVPASKP